MIAVEVTGVGPDTSVTIYTLTNDPDTLRTLEALVPGEFRAVAIGTLVSG